jgi:hypothetical protein
MADSQPESPILTGTLPPDTPELQSFASVPRDRGMLAGFWLAPVAAFYGVVALGFLVPANYLPILNKAPQGLLLIVPVLALAVWVTYRMTRIIGFAWMRAVKRRDFERLGPAAAQERYVGVAYTSGDWAYRGDTSWDRGYLSVRSGAINFRGFGPPFSLPKARIRSVAVKKTESVATNSLPRVFVQWDALDGEPNFVSLEIRDAGNRPATLSAVDELAKWIGTALTETEGTMWKGELPFPSSNFASSRADNVQLATRTDLFVAGAVTFGCVALFAIAEGFVCGRFQVGKPWPSWVVVIPALMVFNGVLERRRRNRASQPDTRS